jgi:hypothetical protein
MHLYPPAFSSACQFNPAASRPERQFQAYPQPPLLSSMDKAAAAIYNKTKRYSGKNTPGGILYLYFQQFIAPAAQ